MPVHVPKTNPFDDSAAISEARAYRCQDDIQDSFSAYLCDESRFPGGCIDELVFTNSEKQIIDALNRASAQDLPVTVSAGRTGIVAGAVPLGGILISLENMRKWYGVRWNDETGKWCVRLQPGISLDTLQENLDQGIFERIPGKNGSTNDNSPVDTAWEKFKSESANWFYPVDPTEKSAHLGGTVATNASGARSFKYGQTREHITGLRVILMDGTVLDLQRGQYIAQAGDSFIIEGNTAPINLPVPFYHAPVVKNAAGYFSSHPMDLIDYFIGSEGTLGVLSAIEISLERKPEFKLCGIAFFEEEKDAIHFVQLLREARKTNDYIDPAAIEYFDSGSLNLLRNKQADDGSGSSIPPFPDGAGAAIYFEQEGKEDDLDNFFEAYDQCLTQCNSSMDETWGGMDQDELTRMAHFRHALPETINGIIGQRQKNCPALYKVGTDFAVPDENLEKMIDVYRQKLDDAGHEYAIFGHIGENHLHVNILPANEKELKEAKTLYTEFAKEAVALNGTISGEHGVGKLKKNLLGLLYKPEALDEMKKIKQSLDPRNLLGNGNLF
ncbi:hypothetical protein BVY01_00530 [bacterium I07]|nr:hypothetical protein BVY01_00530 [bacterium I07]